ncbi:MAG: hypothetical protein Q9181_003070 [Wetmoreana brouardii]
MSNDLFGFKAYKAIMAARRNGTLPMYLGQAMSAAGKNAHTLKQHFPGTTMIMTRDPENMKTILSTRWGHYRLGPVRGDLVSTLIGKNLFTSDGSAWKHSRSLARPQFTQSQITDAGLFENHVRELSRKLEIGEESWSSSVTLSPLFHNLTMDVASEFLFGYSMHTQNPANRAQLPKGHNLPLPELDVVRESFDEASEWLSILTQFGRWGRWIWSPRFNRNVQQVKKLDDFFVDLALSQNVDAVGAAEKNTKQRYYLIEGMSKITQDPKILTQEARGLLFAARSTTATLMTWVSYYLSGQPDTYQKLRVSIRYSVGLDPNAPLDPIKLLHCTYLQNCLQEGVRLGTPTPLIAREAIQDTMLPRGGGEDGEAPVFIPKGTLITLNLFALHHRKDLYGDDVEEFKPERWEVRERSWDMSAFGGGPRACIGREYRPRKRVVILNLIWAEQFALVQTSYVLARIVQRYDKMEKVDSSRDLKYDMKIVNRPASGAQLTFAFALLHYPNFPVQYIFAPPVKSSYQRTQDLFVLGDEIGQLVLDPLLLGGLP